MVEVRVRGAYPGPGRLAAAPDEISLVLPDGLSVAVGPPDSGLERLAMAVAGLVRGVISTIGAGVDSAPLAAPPRVALVPRGAGLPPGLTLREALDAYSLLLGNRDPKSRKETGERLARELELHARLELNTRWLSPAQAYLGCVARALIQEPELLLVWEPAGLTPQDRTESRRILARLTGPAAILVFTPQPDGLDDSESLPVVVIRAGRVRFSGSVSELRSAGEGHVWELLIPAEESREIPAGFVLCEEATSASVTRQRVVGPQPPRPGASDVSPRASDAYQWLLLSDDPAGSRPGPGEGTAE